MSAERLERKKPSALSGLDRAALVSEDQIQESILGWLELVLPDAIVFHVPNGGGRSKPEAAKLKRMGVKPGVPDLEVILPDGLTVRLEVKTAIGRLSVDQQNFHFDLCGMGHLVATVRGVDDTRAALAAWGIKTREARS
jgi:hypothetical protein